LPFKVAEQHDRYEAIDLTVQQIITRLLKTWALEDTPAILAYVYNTLPVKYSKPGELLDFTYETGHLIVEHAMQTAEKFITLDEMIAELEETES